MQNNKLDNEYYLVGCVIPNDVPLLKVDDEVDSTGDAFLFQYRKVATDYVTHLALNSPIPKKPRFIDAMALNGGCSVFSNKIYDTLSKHDIKGLQLVNAVIRGKNDEKHTNYWIANIYQKLAFFDKEQSKYGRINKVTDAWEKIKKIVLNESLLTTVPLEGRLVFVCAENCSLIMYHKSVVDIIMSAKPDGINFTSLDKWNELQPKEDFEINW